MKIERTIDRDSKQKLYVQIYSIIKEKIENGEWPSGTQIPTEDEFCRTYDVSKVTVREAIQELVREGYLKRQQGKGTFVLYSVSHLGLPMRTRLTDVMYGEGVTTRKELLEKRSIEPSEDIRNILLTENEVFFARYKSAVESEYPVMEELYIPLVTLLSINDDDILFRPFFDVIEEKGTKKISKVTQTIEVVKLKEEVAYQLKMKEGTYALCVNRIFYSSDGSPIAFSRGIIGGMKKVSMEFERLK